MTKRKPEVTVQVPNVDRGRPLREALGTMGVTNDAAERLARLFHATYERLAPAHGYRTRDASAKPWEDVPEANRALMIATCAEVLATLAETDILSATEEPEVGRE